jgi:hypothetical protein
MNIHPSMRTALLLLVMLGVLAYSRTADDDEVDTSIPEYPHKFFSGISQHIQDIT